MKPLPHPPTKGFQTRQIILKEALQLAETDGLEGLTIGKLSKVVGMSKSGLYAHFQSKEDLQIQILEEAARQFTEYVIKPATKAPKGISRMRELWKLWLDNIKSETSPSGCLIITSAAEFDERPGAVRDVLIGILNQFRSTLERSIQNAIEEEDLRVSTNPQQFVFEWQSLALGYHQYLKIHPMSQLYTMVQHAFEALIQRHSR